MLGSKVNFKSSGVSQYSLTETDLLLFLFVFFFLRMAGQPL